MWAEVMAETHTHTPTKMYTGSRKGTKKDFPDILSDPRMKECDMRRGL